jgi:hypothetical protein
MSYYDDIEYTSKYEEKNGNFTHLFLIKIIDKLPVQETNENFQSEFVETYKNISNDQIKKMMHLNFNEGKKFDFVFNDQENINEDFFKNSKNLKSDMNNNEKMNVLLEFLKYNYGVMTPKHLKNFFEECKL